MPTINLVVTNPNSFIGPESLLIDQILELNWPFSQVPDKDDNITYIHRTCIYWDDEIGEWVQPSQEFDFVVTKKFFDLKTNKMYFWVNIDSCTYIKDEVVDEPN